MEHRAQIRLLRLCNHLAPSQTLHPHSLRVNLSSNASQLSNIKSQKKKDDEESRSLKSYRYFLPLQTRWADNDQYGHVNNVIYYSYFDTVVNYFLQKEAKFDIKKGDVIAYAVETRCSFFEEISFPENIVAGLLVSHLGSSSVHYQIAIFKEKNMSSSPSLSLPTQLRDKAAAVGTFVQVFVEAKTKRPTPIPPHIKAILAKHTKTAVA
eukprot:TRINITY_DN7145_c0_g1_i1.p1 TRINITY_DN7145_c0_g1~~TRINITY_DN7145_c0_g1_i1.p1  ORF type:complete len:221 (-),score=49.98 TRINITY_DN7145_c0_g1_i1:170-796(-)